MFDKVWYSQNFLKMFELSLLKTSVLENWYLQKNTLKNNIHEYYLRKSLKGNFIQNLLLTISRTSARKAL